MTLYLEEEVTIFIKEARAGVDRALNSLLPPSSLRPVCHYSLFSGGKRFRPLLTLATARFLGFPHQRALPAACAVELIHTYSLIHDDLPCMDNDDFRRGKPTCHRAFSEWQALLAGDALLTLSFSHLSQDPSLSPEQKIEMIQVLSEAAGMMGMIEGQSLDIQGKGMEISREHLRNIHQRKTGDLITAAILLGAIAAGAQEHDKRQLRTFGQHLGLAFQLLDDVKDVLDPSPKQGASSDLRNQTATAVSVASLEEARLWAEEELGKALSVLDYFPYPTAVLQSLAHSLLEMSKGRE